MSKVWQYRKNPSFFFLLILFTLSLVLVIFLYLSSFEIKEVFSESKSELLNLNLWQKDAINLSLKSANKDLSIDTPVSISSFRKRDYFVANYSKIYLFSPEKGEFSEMQPVMGTEATYVPTGVFFSSKHNALFVANYTGNNILVFDVDSKAKKLFLRTEIKTNNTISPENVFVSRDGRYLASANYDGSTVTCFGFSSGKWRELWATKVENAHGVAIVDKFVYATSLGERALLELDIQNGAVLRRTGQLGWEPLKGGFLWPTSVYPVSEKQLIVSDGHTGFISIVDRRKFQVVKYFGGTGPTYRYFNMPYSAILHKNYLIVGSACQNRIAFIDLRNGNRVENYVFNNSDWNYIYRNKEILNNSKRLGDGWQKYIWKEGPTVDIFNREYLLGYSRIIPKKEDYSPQVVFPEIGSPFTNFLSFYFYFMDYIPLKRGKIFFSPQSPSALYVEERRGIYYLVPFILGIDSWRVGKVLINSKNQVDLIKLSEEADKIVTQLNAIRGEDKLIKLNDFCKILFKNLPYQRLEGEIEKIFRSNAAKTWLKTYKECQQDSCKRAKVEDASNAYFSKVMKEAEVNLDEILSIQMLSGYTGTY